MCIDSGSSSPSDYNYYSIIVRNKFGLVFGEYGLDIESAKSKAIAMASEYQFCEIFVEWQCKFTGSHGYLNKNGSHTLPAERW